MRTSRRFALAVLTACVAASVLAACGGDDEKPASGGVHKVSAVVFPGAFPSFQAYVAEAKGFFKEEGLEVELVGTGNSSSSFSVLASNSAQFAISGYAQVAAYNAQGGGAKVIAGLLNAIPITIQCQKDLGLEPDQDFPEIIDTLRGLKLAVLAPNVPATDAMIYMEKKAGRPGGVKYVNVGSPVNVDASLKSGAVDCGMQYQPTSSQYAKNDSFTEVYSFEKVGLDGGPTEPAEYADFAFNGFATLDAYAKKNPEVVARFRNAILKADDYAADPNHAVELADLTSTYFSGIDKSLLVDVIKATAPITKGKVTETGFDNAMEAALAGGTLKSKPAYEDLVDLGSGS